MAETESKTQLPFGAPPQPRGNDGEPAAMERALDLGRKYAEQAIRRLAAWAEENPGQLLLAGVAAGFVVGKVFFKPRTRSADGN